MVLKSLQTLAKKHHSQPKKDTLSKTTIHKICSKQKQVFKASKSLCLTTKEIKEITLQQSKCKESH